MDRSNDVRALCSACLAAWCAAVFARGACAEGVVVTSEPTGSDVVARFFHRASLLDTGDAMVSGGMRLQIVPPSLVTLDAIAFHDPFTGLFSACFAPLVGGADVEPVLVVARSSHTQTTLADGRVLMTGGRSGASGTSAGTPVSSVELFDPFDGSVALGPAMSEARTSHTASRLSDGRVLVAGGATWEIFEPGAGGEEWGQGGALGHVRVAHAAVHLPAGTGGIEGERVLLIGGAGTGPRTLEIVDPARATSVLSSALLDVGVDDLAAVLLGDGRVLIVGGQDLSTGDTIAHAYRYDPADDTLASLPPPPALVRAGVADHQLVCLASGWGRFAILFGGESQQAGQDEVLSAIAVFDRVTGTWVAEAALAQPRDDFAAVVLADESILLVAGGVGFLGQEVPTNTAERASLTPLRPADLDGNGAVGFSDLVALLISWGPCAPGGDCVADLDGSGAVGFADLSTLLIAWGPCA